MHIVKATSFDIQVVPFELKVKKILMLMKRAIPTENYNRSR